MTIRTVGIIGYGAFGSFLCVLIQRFAPHVSIRVFSRTHKPDTKTFFTLVEVAECDAVILAVPISALQSVIKKIVPLLKSSSILVDVSTVKKYPVSLLKKYAKGKSYITTHPMWGPESYKKKDGDVTGFRIVITETTIPKKEVEEFCQILESVGFKTLRMSPDAHDKHLAETLFLTHFIGQIVSRAKFDRTEIDTVSFGYLMDAVESVKHDKKLFADVFKYNPFCKDALDRFGTKEKEVRKILEK